MAKPAIKTFNATLLRAGAGLKWVILEIPFDLAKVWGKRGQIRVKGEMKGFSFRTALRPTGRGSHIMMVTRKTPAGAGVAPGEKVRVRMEPDTAERILKIPPELRRFFTEERALARWFETQLNPSTQRGIADWVGQAKSAGSRQRRAEQIAERLLSTMEAERELPPAIAIAFGCNAAAREGWQCMTPALRRRHLLTIFYYRDPESRSRAIEKAVQEAGAYAEKKSGKGKKQLGE